MKKLYDDLWQCERHSSGILNTHAYLLTREQGNVLFYNTEYPEDLDHIEALGGIRYQLLTHRDEIGPAIEGNKTRFNSQLGIGEREVSFAEKFASVDLVFGSTDIELENILVINTPGHSDGSICYYYKSPHGKSYLFSGDTIFQSRGQRSTFVIPSFGSTKAELAISLGKLYELQPDAVISSGFVGDLPYREVSGDEWRAVLDEAISKLT